MAEAVERVVRAALAEDVGFGDVTTTSVVPGGARCRALVILEEPGVVCGLEVVAAVFRALDPTVQVTPLVERGARITEAPMALAEVRGWARPILTGERTALNLLARLCGIASLTRQYVDRVEGTGVTILDTRKTTAGLRALERCAVSCGGAANHRIGLDDTTLVTHNHRRLAGGITAAVTALRERAPRMEIELEAATLDDVREALAAEVDRIQLTNMTPAQVKQAVELVAGRTQLQATGRITLAAVRAYADTGVDFISIAALTNAARSLHLSLELQ